MIVWLLLNKTLTDGRDSCNIASLYRNGSIDINIVMIQQKEIADYNNNVMWYIIIDLLIFTPLIIDY